MPYNHRGGAALDALGILAPITALLILLGYSRTRVRAAWNDERGLSHTVEIAIWAGVAVLAVVGIGSIIVVAVTNRSKSVGTDIENKQLP